MPFRHLVTRIVLPAALALVAFVAARPAAAAESLSNSTVITSLEPSQIKSLLDDMNVIYKQDKDDEGDPTFTFKAGSYNVILFVYAKDAATGGYASLQMYIGFSDKVPLSKINAWNAQRRYIRAYQSDNGGSRLESDLDLSGGVTVGAVKTFLHKFEGWADAFATHLASK